MKRLLHALAALWPWETGGGRPKTEERWRSGEYSWLPAARTGLLQHLAAVLRMDRVLSGFADLPLGGCADVPIRKFAKEPTNASALNVLPVLDGGLDLSEREQSKFANSQIRKFAKSEQSKFADSQIRESATKLLATAVATLLAVFMCLMAAKQVSAQAEPAEAAGMETQVLEKDLDKFPMVKYDPDLSHVKGLVIGDSIPDYLWDLPLWVVNDPEGRDTITLREYESSQLLVLDFWARWCAPCVASMDKWEGYIRQLPGRATLIGVHLDFDYKALPFTTKKGWDSPTVIGENAYTVNRHFFDQNVISRMAWIRGGKLIAITSGRGYDLATVTDVVEGRPVDIPMDYNWTYHSDHVAKP